MWRFWILYCCNSITQLATLLELNAHLCKKIKICYQCTALSCVSEHTSWIFGAHIQLQGVPARRWNTVVLPVLALAMLLTLFWFHHPLWSALPLRSTHWRHCVLYIAGYHPDGSGGSYSWIFRVVSQKPTAFRWTISICSASATVQGVAQRNSRS